MNKKGTDKILSVYWFAILFIVAAGVVYMAASFYGGQYDVRKIEADILTNKIADCLAERGYLKEDVYGGLSNDNFLTRCNLNFNVEDTKEWKNDQHYVEIYSGDMNVLSYGNSNWVSSCNQGDNNPKCIEREFYTLDGTNSLIIKIFVGVRKTEKNE